MYDSNFQLKHFCMKWKNNWHLHSCKNGNLQKGNKLNYIMSFKTPSCKIKVVLTTR